MSLILEALRKSEAERRRAQMPDLLTEAPLAAPVAVRAPQRWPWIAGGAAIMLAALWFATRGPAAPPQVAAGDDSIAATAATPAPTRATPTVPPAPKPATPVRRPLVIAPPAPVAPAPVAPTRPAATQVAAAPTAPPPAPMRAAPATLPAAPAPTFERLADLGSEERKQLPPLKLSMHMWNDVAAQRFVIIDGARLGVGDRLGALVVADILPDGVVLDWNGRAFKLPIR